MFADVGTIANHQDFPLRKPPRQHCYHLGGQLALRAVFLLGFAPLFLVDPPQNRQAEVTVRAERKLDDDAEHHPVIAEAKDLMLFRAEDGIKEDTTEGDLGSSFMGKRVVDNRPETDAWQQRHNLQQQQAADFIPIPNRLAERAIESSMIALFGLTGRLPDSADGTATEANDPGSDQRTEPGVNLLAKGTCQRV